MCVVAVPNDGGGLEGHADSATREVDAEPDVGGEQSRTEAADEVEGSSLDEEIGGLAEPAHVRAAAEDAAELACEGPDLRTARDGLGAPRSRRRRPRPRRRERRVAPASPPPERSRGR